MNNRLKSAIWFAFAASGAWLFFGAARHFLGR